MLCMNKKCSRCGFEKPLNMFQSDNRYAFGVKGVCKSCAAFRAKELRKNNPERAREIKRKRYQAGADRNRASRRAYYKENMESERASSLERQRKRRADDPQAVNESVRRSKERHRQKHLATKRAYNALNADRNREWARAARAADPDRYKAHSRNRKARLRAAEGKHTGADIKEIYAKQQGACVYCGSFLGTKYHVDHIIPLASGGSNWPENIQITCPSCNLSKGAKDPVAFAMGIGLSS